MRKGRDGVNGMDERERAAAGRRRVSVGVGREGSGSWGGL
jgi:hypothetical protein